jgi:hypothetical protein
MEIDGTKQDLENAGPARTVFFSALRRGDVYGIRCGEFIKIGRAADVNDRIVTMGLYNPYPIDLVFTRRTAAPLFYERKMHEILAAHAIGREWFKVTLDQVRLAASTTDVYIWDLVKRAKLADRERARKLTEMRRSALGR